MRFHRISPCPKCGGKVKAKWERDGVLRMLADDVEIMAREKEMGGGQ